MVYRFITLGPEVFRSVIYIFICESVYVSEYVCVCERVRVSE
jgi:hypothetical protein